MIGTVTFYSFPGVANATGTYPLFSSGQDISGYKVKEFTKVKFTADLDQSVRVPEWTGYQEPNVVYLQNVGYFWITGFRTSTNSVGSIDFALSYIACTSCILKDGKLKGSWIRLPDWDTYQQETIVNDSMGIADRDYFPLGSIGYKTITNVETHIGESGKDYKAYIYWVEITSTKRLAVGSYSASNDSLTRYGMFAYYIPGAGEKDKIAYKMPYWDTGTHTYAYPSLFDIINDPDTTFGLPASSIKNISISSRCPYEYSWEILTSSNIQGLVLVDSYGEYITPNALKAVSSNYDIGIYMLIAAKSTVGQNGPTPNTFSTLGYKVLTAYQATNGRLRIVDEMQNPIGDVDISTLPYINPPGGLTLYPKVRCISDFTGIYTIVEIEGYYWVFTEGHLPWVGSTWEEYQAYSMDTDRQAVMNAKNMLDEKQRIDMINAGIGTIGSVGQGAMSGFAAGGYLGAAVGGGMAIGNLPLAYFRSEMDKGLAMKRLDMDQALTEKRMKDAPGHAYGTSYGLYYCEQQALNGGAQIMLMMPANLDQTAWEDHTDKFGFPAQGVSEQTVKGGFYQGRIYESNDLTGPRMDRLNREFAEGVRFIDLSIIPQIYDLEAIDMWNASFPSPFIIAKGSTLKITGSVDPGQSDIHYGVLINVSNGNTPVNDDGSTPYPTGFPSALTAVTGSTAWLNLLDGYTYNIGEMSSSVTLNTTGTYAITIYKHQNGNATYGGKQITVKVIS